MAKKTSRLELPDSEFVTLVTRKGTFVLSVEDIHYGTAKELLRSGDGLSRSIYQVGYSSEKVDVVKDIPKAPFVIPKAPGFIPKPPIN